MELAEYGVFADKCFRDTPPPCAAVCPLAYDVREFIRLMRKGSIRSAYKILRGSLIFPSVIVRACPEYCRRTCVRGRLEGDESIDLKGLEQICVDKMAGKDPERYNIPPKSAGIAVIGGGLSGLACAYRLASYGYRVKVFEKTALLGGELPEGMDRQWCHDEITREFKAVRCDFGMETEICSLSEIDADAIYIATGEGGADFRDEGSGFTGIIMRGGASAGADLMESVRMGLTAAEDMNNLLLTFRAERSEDITLEVPERQADERYYSLHYDTAVPEEIPDKGAPEAFRCMRCSCSECYDICPLMGKHKQYPKKICNEMIVTLKPNKSRRTAVRMIMGCTECHMCREACPENIDMGKCLQEARTDFYESGAMSPAFHDYWLQDMDFCESDEARLFAVTDESRSADVLYFPGCQLSASMPELTVRSYEALQKASENPAVLLGCCGVPAKWAGRKADHRKVRDRILSDWERAGRPLVVTACPSCLENMKDMHPDMKVVSYYSYAAEHPEMIGANSAAGQAGDVSRGARIKVIDPCSSVSEPGMAESIRSLLDAAGYEIINGDPDPACCGFGGHIYNAVPALHDTFAERRIEDIADTDIIAASYCANCRDILAYRGADARHVLGMLLGIEEIRRQPPELSERRDNRRTVRGILAHCEPEGDSGEDTGMEILISEELIRRMDRELILREQVNEIICEAEETGSKVYDEEDNVFISHKKFGTVTIWTVYSRSGDTVTVENVYLHRMTVREDA